MNKKVVYLLLTCILVLGGILRYHNLNEWPREGATFDEYAWTFLGISIINTGIPTSWSPHKAYTNKVQYINPHGASFFLATPYLEHPPLFGIVSGIFAKLEGINTFDQVTIQSVRPLSLFLGICSIGAVFLLSSTVYGNIVGLVCALFYAIVPTIVSGSRILQNENFFIPLFLVTIWSGYVFVKTGKKIFLIIGSIISGLLVLAKIPWIAAGVGIICMFLYAKKYKAIFWVGVSIFLSLVLFFLYGWFWDWNLFINLWKLQLARYDMTFASVFSLFTDPIVTDRLFLDGWIYIGWGAFLFLIFDGIKKHWPIMFALAGYGVIYLFAIPSEAGHGWYRFPFYPMLIICLGYSVVHFFNKNYIFTFIFLVITGLSMLSHTWLPMFGFSYGIYRMYLLMCTLGAMPLLVDSIRMKRISTLINYGLFLFILFVTACAGLSYNEQ